MQQLGRQRILPDRRRYVKYVTEFAKTDFPTQTPDPPSRSSAVLSSRASKRSCGLVTLTGSAIGMATRPLQMPSPSRASRRLRAKISPRTQSRARKVAPSNRSTTSPSCACSTQGTRFHSTVSRYTCRMMSCKLISHRAPTCFASLYPDDAAEGALLDVKLSRRCKSSVPSSSWRSR